MSVGARRTSTFFFTASGPGSGQRGRGRTLLLEALLEICFGPGSGLGDALEPRGHLMRDAIRSACTPPRHSGHPRWAPDEGRNQAILVPRASSSPLMRDAIRPSSCLELTSSAAAAPATSRARCTESTSRSSESMRRCAASSSDERPLSSSLVWGNARAVVSTCMQGRSSVASSVRPLSSSLVWGSASAPMRALW